MEYTPIITDTTFAGPKADVLAGASGWLAVVLVVAGIGLIIRVLIPK